MVRKAGILLASLILISMAATAQETWSELSLQGTGFFTKSTTGGNGISYSATESAGFLGTYRYHLNHRISLEGAYGYSVDTQKYSLTSSPFRIQTGVHQFTGSFVVNLPSRAKSKLNPYILAGGGALLFAPTSNQFNSLSGAQSQAKGAFVYGAGLNYGIRSGISLRAEYRGLLYGTPDFGFGALSTNAVTHTAVPSVGISFRL
jgi:opacity protein-like surface antigen